MIRKTEKSGKLWRCKQLFFGTGVLLMCFLLVHPVFADNYEYLPSGLNAYSVTGINDNNVIIGTGGFAGGAVGGMDGYPYTKGFTYSNGAYSVIHLPGMLESQTTGINNNNVIVGFAYGSGYINGSDYIHTGFTYNNGTYTVINPPSGLNITRFTGINNNGVILGMAWLEDSMNRPGTGLTGFTYSNGAYSYIGTPSRFDSTYFSGINNSGTIVGYGRNSSTSLSECFIYNNGTYTFFNPPSEIGGSPVFTGINDNGVIAGTAWGGKTGFIYKDGTYTIINPPTGMDAIDVFGINNNGIIAGSVWNDTAMGAYTYSNGTFNILLTEGSVAPVPLPSALLLFAPGLVGLATIRRRFRK
jgi:hypothetical protein